MFLVSTTQQHNHAFVNNHHPSLPIQSSTASPPGSVSPEDSKYRLLNPVSSSMERSAPEYSQSGLPSPYPSSLGDNPSEASSSADPASAAQYATQQDVRPANYSTSATPTSEYGFHPSSARSSSFPEHIQRPPYHPASTHAGSSGDPSITAPSPTYPHSGQYSPYTPQEMTHGYQHTQSGIYPQPRPDWSNYQQNPITPGHAIYHPHAPAAAAAPRQPQGQVYSFVPIPGAQQHKRPRRRYEEIERMYKCGWNGCEKAYGTLNHLNAHVTMQSHGQKRTPEEFKEIRKEWKARKKEEEAQRKADEERQRQAQAAQMQQAQQAAAAAGAAQNGAPEAQATSDPTQPPTTYATARQVQLPPIGYQPANYPAPPSGQQPLPENYNPGNIYSPSSYGNPTSPYGQNPTQAMYGHPPNGAQPPSQ